MITKTVVIYSTAVLSLLGGFTVPSYAEPMMDCGCYVAVTNCEDKWDDVPYATRRGRFVGHFDENGTPQSIVEPASCSTTLVHVHHEHNHQNH